MLFVNTRKALFIFRLLKDSGSFWHDKCDYIRTSFTFCIYRYIGKYEYAVLVQFIVMQLKICVDHSFLAVCKHQGINIGITGIATRLQLPGQLVDIIPK